MKFSKMHSLGNDYIYINCMETPLENPTEMAVKLSDRHFGAGSDGLILIEPSDNADFFMSVYNSDGSRAAMCGNGIRCFGKYVYEKGLTDNKDVSIETLAGIKKLQLSVIDDTVVSVRVNMGSPSFLPEDIPVTVSAKSAIGWPVVIGDKIYLVNCVSMGNPHAVVYVEDFEELDIEKIGRAIETHILFPDRTNVEFVSVTDKKNISIKVYERGSGITLACGTGACASAVMSVLKGYTNEKVTVHMEYGELVVFWNRENNQVYLDGGAVLVYDGEYYN